MLVTPHHVKQYQSAHQRFFKPSITRFLMTSFPGFFGQNIASKVADELLNIFEKLHPERDYLKPGQVFWNALDKNTRGDSPKRRFIPVVLTLVNQQDINMLTQGAKVSKVTELAIARMIKEAYQQGGILSNRDLSLITLSSPARTSIRRAAFEKKHDILLPHTGILHDMGSCLTHKKQIVFKVVVEKKDPAVVAQLTNHSQKAVDHYLQDYNRVKTVFKNNPDINYIHLVTNISKKVIQQYIELFQEFENP